jgi:starvation-inducible DNA-binding protein
MNTTEKNNVGLLQTAVQPVIAELGRLLADYQIFYTNLRGFHWNIRGDKFYELHEVYEGYYNEMADRIDSVAERIVMLGGVPANSFSDYLKTARIKEVSAVSDWKIGVTHVLHNLQALLDGLRLLLPLAIKANDAATIHLINHDVMSFEKKVWMVSAYLQD